MLVLFNLRSEVSPFLYSASLYCPIYPALLRKLEVEEMPMLTGWMCCTDGRDSKPDNVEWVLGDVEKEWPFEKESFDLIHLSLVHGCVADWGGMMTKIKRYV